MEDRARAKMIDGTAALTCSRTTVMRFILGATALAMFAYLMPPPAAAETHEGVVRQIRIDGGSNAPLCAATTPEMPGGT